MKMRIISSCGILLICLIFLIGIIGVVVSAIIPADVFSNIFTHTREYLSIQDDEVFFGMSLKKLIKIKGEPEEIHYDTCDTPFDLYIFDEQLYGFEAKGYYTFCKSFFGSYLMDSTIIIENLSYDDGEFLFNKVLNSFEEFYAKRNNFYKEEPESDGSTYIKISLGINTGATGIFCDIIYKDNSLIVNVDT